MLLIARSLGSSPTVDVLDDEKEAELAHVLAAGEDLLPEDYGEEFLARGGLVAPQLHWQFGSGAA